MCVRTYHVRNNYVTYIVAMRPYYYFIRLLCVAAMRGSAMRKMKVSESGLQLQLYTTLYDSNAAAPSNPRYRDS